MPAERFDETEEGYYVQHGDVREWHWKDDKEPADPAPVTTTKAKAVAKKPRKKK